VEDPKDGAGRVLRFIASWGFADEDRDVVAELLAAAQWMAKMIIAEGTSSLEPRRTATAFLDQLGSDTFGVP
jgi:hypothetical protein